MPNNTLPDDLNPALIEVCARFIGKLTGLVPSPVADFPPEMHAAFRAFASEVYAIVRENITGPEPRAEVTDDDKVCASRYRWLSRQVVATHSRDDLSCRWEVDYVLRGKSFDAAVDAARAAAAG
ncbi:hypothetical protein [Burkholderia multivorans]|uniref:hypothetical protein n=1 Tax=Burkholderia multivorans TaxID=87883 RepID=UPI000CFF8E4B|nr:hypothetical protein [Burkholderia multivorans]MBU9581334.1 hypothetical protein [Burkholderia multivorans]PRE16966.1 hypothetical protein C6P92_13930 [Burkholderia multivorans]PRF32979.1 hypothetical protein C6Q08_12960 [Burkholderia multivorans]PRG46062.1 hypothetical protein C6T62_05160 [Burkholderia multivorans]